MILRFCWRGLSPALPGTRLSEYTRVGYFPTSYPTGPSRRLMGPAANARTDRMVYVDCREDYRTTGVIYINGMAMSRDLFFPQLVESFSSTTGFPSAVEFYRFF